MKSAIATLMMITALSACSLVPFNAQPAAVHQLAPDVPAIPKDIQKQAAMEMKSGAAPAENQIINACLVTRDEARILMK